MQGVNGAPNELSSINKMFLKLIFTYIQVFKQLKSDQAGLFPHTTFKFWILSPPYLYPIEQHYTLNQFTVQAKYLTTKAWFGITALNMAWAHN